MPDVSTEPEIPACPGCDYLLTGLRSQTCPECGASLGPDLSLYLPSRRPTPWSPGRHPWPMFLRGLFAVVTRPVRTLAACDDPARATAGRAATFAAVTSTLLVLAWPVLRDGGSALSRQVGGRPGEGRQWFHLLLTQYLSRLGHWTDICRWEAWAVLRWWCLFGVLAVTASLPSAARRDGAMAARAKRLLLFAPWIAILELALLAVAYISDARVLPEPSTLWSIMRDDDWKDISAILQEWAVRSTFPLLLVGFLFCRAVLRWTNLWSAVGAAGVALLGVPLSPIWSGFYIALSR